MSDLALMLFLMALVTFLPRVIPVLLLSRRSLPRPIVRWLSFVPVAVLAALLAPALFTPAGRFDLAISANPAFWVSIPVFIVAVFTRNLFLTVLAGMILMALTRLLLL